MTQPRHEDDLPTGPWRVVHHHAGDDEWWDVQADDGKIIIACYWEELARAIAAIPEMRAELDRLSVEIETLRAQMHGMQDGSLVRDQNTELHRLRAEKAELVDFVKHYMGAAYKTGERGSLFYKGERLIAKANETEA